MSIIYALQDPRTKEYRYIGKTDTNIRRRLSGHLKQARDGSNFHVYNWLRGLISEGLIPTVDIIDEVPKNEWEQWERFYIAFFRIIGCNLTNMTSGGDCGADVSGRKQTAEHIKKRVESRLAYFKEHPEEELLRKEKARQAMRTDTSRNKLKASLIKVHKTEEYKHNASKAQKGHIVSEQTREKLRIAAEKQWKNPENLKLLCERRKAYCNSKEGKEHMRSIGIKRRLSEKA